jgi:branched-chain amino acid transport system permease protein
MVVQLAFELLTLGLFLGAFYGLIALGLSLVFGVQNVINIAHGEFVMLGAYVAFFGWSLLGLNPVVSMLAGLPVMFVLGASLQWALLERVQGSDELTTLILTFGLALALRSLAQFAFTSDYRSIDFLSRSVTVFETSFSLNRPLGFAIALGGAVAFFAFLKYTDWGKAIRATSQNAEVARACGINTRHVRMVTFGLGAATAGVAGGIAGMLFTIFPAMGLEYLLKSFVVVVLGGLGSLVGAVVAGLGFGVVETGGTFFLSSTVATLIAFVVLIVTLIVRPQGLFGRSEADG